MEATERKPWQFQPGNNGGRRKGVQNKITLEKKQRLDKIIEIIEENLEEKIASLKPKEQVDLWLQLQEYVRPKLQRVNVDIGPAEDKLTKITFEVIHTTMLPGQTVPKILTIANEDPSFGSIPQEL